MLILLTPYKSLFLMKTLHFRIREVQISNWELRTMTDLVVLYVEKPSVYFLPSLGSSILQVKDRAIILG